MPFKKRLRRFVIIFCFTIILIRLLMPVLGLHLYSVNVDYTLVWLLLCIGLLLLNLFTVEGISKDMNIIFGVCLIAVIPMFLFFKGLGGHVGNIHTYRFKNLDKAVLSYFHQGSWGGTPYENFILGESYLGGFIYTNEAEVQLHAEQKYYSDELFDIGYAAPPNVRSKNLFVVWEKEGLLLDMTDMVCYPLEKQK